MGYTCCYHFSGDQLARQPISGFKAHPARDDFRDYATEVPPGTWVGCLDHLAWGKAHNLLLYFTVEPTGEKYRLSTFWNRQYRPHGDGPDFADEATSGRFEITTKPSRNGFPDFTKAGTMTMIPGFAFSCTKCGQCCKGGGPALSIDEIFKYQDTFISGLRWGGYAVSKNLFTTLDRNYLLESAKLYDHLGAFCTSFPDRGDTIYPHIYPLATGYDLAPGRACTALDEDGSCKLHPDKPDMCRSVPFDAALPESARDFALRGSTIFV